MQDKDKKQHQERRKNIDITTKKEYQGWEYKATPGEKKKPLWNN